MAGEGRAPLPAWFKGLLLLVLAAGAWVTVDGWGYASRLEMAHPALHRLHVAAILGILLLTMNAWAWGVGRDLKGDVAAGKWTGPAAGVGSLLVTLAAAIRYAKGRVVIDDAYVAAVDVPILVAGFAAAAAGTALGAWHRARSRAGAGGSPPARRRAPSWGGWIPIVLLTGFLPLGIFIAFEGLPPGRRGAAPAVPAGRLPVLGTVGDLPPEAGRLVVEVDAGSRILVDGREIPFEALRELLRQRADGTREETGGRPSNLDVVLRVDRDLPWTKVLRLMEACALPEVRLHRLHFAALPEGGGEEGAFATFLPGGPRPGVGDASAGAAGPVTVPLRLSPDPSGATSLDRDLLPFLGTTWTDLGWESIQVSFEAAPDAPAGVALRTVETILRSGVDSVVFRRPASGAPADPPAPAGSPRGWAVTVFDSSMPTFTGEFPPLPPPGRISGRAAGQTVSPVITDHGHRPPPPGSAAARAARAAALRATGGEGTEEAVEAALDWLARHQSANGAWDAEGFEAQCKIAKCGGAGNGRYTPGVTGLALAAFLGQGETHKTPAHGAVVRAGLKYLKGIQDVTGRFGVSSAVEGLAPRFRLLLNSDIAIYNHPLATLAMVEAWDRTRSPLFKESAEKAVAFIVQAQNPYLGWRYGDRPMDNDTSVTAWMVLALHAADRAGLDVPSAAFEGATAWIDRVTDPETGRAGYTARGNGPARAQELLDRFPPDRSESTTAMALLVRLLAGAPADDREVLRGADLCLRVPPAWDDAAGSVDHVYWFFGTNVLFRVGGDRWRAWNGAMKTALVGNQRVDRADDRFGSWDPVDPWSTQGGRACATALNALTLETYYREAPAAEGR